MRKSKNFKILNLDPHLLFRRIEVIWVWGEVLLTKLFNIEIYIFTGEEMLLMKLLDIEFDSLYFLQEKSVIDIIIYGVVFTVLWKGGPGK